MNMMCDVFVIVLQGIEQSVIAFCAWCVCESWPVDLARDPSTNKLLVTRFRFQRAWSWECSTGDACLSHSVCPSITVRCMSVCIRGASCRAVGLVNQVPACWDLRLKEDLVIISSLQSPWCVYHCKFEKKNIGYVRSLKFPQDTSHTKVQSH